MPDIEQPEEKKKRPLTARAVGNFAAELTPSVLVTFNAEELLFVRDNWLPALAKIVDAECQKRAEALAGKKNG